MSRKSIVLVSVDCLRADHVGFMGYEGPTTPFLDSLAAESTIFSLGIAAGAPTYYSFPAILGSRYPLALGRDVLGLAPEEPTLASVAKAAGYATASFGAANPYISARFGYARGFDTFHDFLDSDFLKEEPAPLSNEIVALEGNGWVSRFNRNLQRMNSALGQLGIVYNELYFQYCQRVAPVPESLDKLRRFPAADVIVDHAGKWLESIGDKPFFLWLHLMDPHAPYYPKEEALALMGRDSVTPFRARYLNSYWNRGDIGARRLMRHRAEVIELYDAGIRWVDVQMKRLIDAMRASGQWENCVFAFTADHGEEFLDHGGRFHPPSRLMEELIHVPLLLRVAGAEKRKVANGPFSLLHLAPTLLDAAGLDRPPEFQGRSYWPQLELADAIAIAESVSGCTNPLRRENRLGPRVLAVREGRYKLVLHFDPRAEYLYDLEADPGEQAPLAPHAQRPVRRRLLEAAREHLQRPVDEQNRLLGQLRDLRQETSGQETSSQERSGQERSGQEVIG